MDTPYIPISCDIHEQMLAYFILRQQCAIAYRDNDGWVVSVEDWIVDVYIEACAEGLIGNSGTLHISS